GRAGHPPRADPFGDGKRQCSVFRHDHEPAAASHRFRLRGEVGMGQASGQFAVHARPDDRHFGARHHPRHDRRQSRDDRYIVPAPGFPRRHDPRRDGNPLGAGVEVEARPRRSRDAASRLRPAWRSPRPLPAADDGSEQARLMRSLLFVPGDSERKLAKGLASGADVLIVDLEDSVAAENKAAARETAAAFIASERQGPAIYVRVNDLSTGLTDDDLAAVMKAAPAGIMLPKSNSADDVGRLAVRLRVHEAENGLADGITKIIPIITETPLGTLNAATYRHAGARLAGLTWGAEDLSAEIGAADTRDG